MTPTDLVLPQVELPVLFFGPAYAIHNCSEHVCCLLISRGPVGSSGLIMSQLLLLTRHLDQYPLLSSPNLTSLPAGLLLEHLAAQSHDLGLSAARLRH